MKEKKKRNIKLTNQSILQMTNKGSKWPTNKMIQICNAKAWSK